MADDDRKLTYSERDRVRREGGGPAKGRAARDEAHASKAALASLVRTIAVELGPFGIRANGIQLGPMEGENLHGYLESLAQEAGRTYEEEVALYNEQFALGYTPTTEECAGTALFLASDLARPITGQSIAVNGGKWFLT